MISHPELREPSQMRQTLIGVLILIVFLSGVFLVPASSGQVAGQLETTDTHATLQAESAKTQESGGSQSPASTTPEKEPEKTKKKKLPGRGAILVAPLPIVSPAIGNGLIPVVGYIFPFSKNDKESPPSTIGALGIITNNGSRGFALGGQLFLKQNTYEVTFGYGKGNLNYNLYGIGTIAALQGLKLPLEQSGKVYFGEVLRRVGWKIFVGPRLWDGTSFVTVRPNGGGNLPPIPPGVGLHSNLTAIGIRVVRDTRPNHFYPTAGTKLEFTSNFYATALGSKYSYQSYQFRFNKYWSLDKIQVLAYDLAVCDTGGSPPFYGNCIYGTNNELRGYAAGQFIDRHMFATQLEYRLSLPKGFGLAGFVGVGEIFPSGSHILRVNQVLPDIGGGPRYQLSSKYHVNLRTDFARGRNSWTWSMGVGEAF
jgi:Omp85 superfamily domain